MLFVITAGLENSFTMVKSSLLLLEIASMRVTRAFFVSRSYRWQRLSAVLKVFLLFVEAFGVPELSVHKPACFVNLLHFILLMGAMLWLMLLE